MAESTKRLGLPNPDIGQLNWADQWYLLTEILDNYPGIKIVENKEYPSNAWIGQLIYDVEDTSFKSWNGSSWVGLSGGGGLYSVVTSETIPSNPVLGQMIFISDLNLIQIFALGEWITLHDLNSEPFNYTNYSEFEVGKQPEILTSIWSVYSEAFVKEDEDSIEGKILEFPESYNSNTTLQRSFVINAIEPHENTDVGMHINAGNFAWGYPAFHLIGRLSIDPDDRTYYSFEANRNDNKIKLNKYINNVKTVLSEENFTISSNAKYKMRLKIDGNQLMGKIWSGTLVEPEDWMLTASDSDITGKGLTGFSIHLRLEIKQYELWWEIQK